MKNKYLYSIILLGVILILLIFVYAENLIDFISDKNYRNKPINKKSFKPIQRIEYKVIPLINDDYFDIVLEEIENAKQSIKIVMYIIQLDDEDIYTLIDTLIDKKNEGLIVKVILSNADENINPKLYNANSETIEYLKNFCVDSEINLKNDETHDKLILIDGKTAIIGAHNWTKQSLKFNNEISILIKSDTEIGDIINYIKRF